MKNIRTIIEKSTSYQDFVERCRDCWNDYVNTTALMKDFDSGKQIVLKDNTV